jgi:hypothetical protein
VRPCSRSSHEHHPDSNIIEPNELKDFLLQVIKEEGPADLYYMLLPAAAVERRR